ncbi:hypothetical protein ACVWYG_002330 [Pedobacter sp. UYEF25]
MGHLFGTLLAQYSFMNSIKKIYLIFGVVALMLTSSCYTARRSGNSGKVPPGQAKKGTGSKSAKPFAPGQQKKN